MFQHATIYPSRLCARPWRKSRPMKNRLPLPDRNLVTIPPGLDVTIRPRKVALMALKLRDAKEYLARTTTSRSSAYECLTCGVTHKSRSECPYKHPAVNCLLCEDDPEHARHYCLDGIVQ